ncbi:von Willebrand factor A domain-containing protein 1 isoform X2 [Leopardus geoffroyi]|uniref:von Willebrand factor A domain-containing protein 1 isoform X2 n=1 Tax=Leopardus geoffroyi TaxID=46844 RepID=UPI001E2618E5|nr:von Willebrand factor A domain-containing protein 1 isoform X2 [Leopardus geoffroyi]XP_058575434.1 von Willebrand factor A domain-containing protein 1 isoform X2 [Neofelis nebulosa]
MLPWTALSLALSLRLALARSGAERGAEGPGCYRLHRQYRSWQPPGAVSCCLGPRRGSPALCGRGRPAHHCPGAEGVHS